MGLFDFFGKSKMEKENAQLIQGVTFEECLADLFGENPDEMILRRAYAYYQLGSGFKLNSTDEIPESSKTVYMLLLQYYEELPQNMDIVASNITCATYELLEDAEERDPYEAKAMLENLFAKWPKAFHFAMRTAEKDESDEDNLIFLCCINLFGWNGKVDVAKAKTYVKKIDALDDIEHYSVYEWLKQAVASK